MSMEEKSIITTMQPDQIDDYVEYFIDTNISLLYKLCYKVYQSCNDAVFTAFKENIRVALDYAFSKFLGKKIDFEYLDRYLFGSLHRKVKSLINQYMAYKFICPACKYNGNLGFLTTTSKNSLFCYYCDNLYHRSNIEWEKKLSNAFRDHSKTGYKCPDCERFLPRSPFDTISCPYPDCFFAGKVDELKIMGHPQAGVSFPESSSVGKGGGRVDPNACLMQVREEIKYYYDLVKTTIQEQQAALEFTTWSSTLITKWSMYQAFLNVLEYEQEEMVSYLAKLGPHSRKSNIQTKVFQEYVKEIETKIPFSFTKAEKEYQVNSLLDANLNLFDGESVFKGEVNEEFEIPNGTKEYYIGGREGKYCLPYYIGKLIEIRDIKKNVSLMNKVIDYSFVRIKMIDVAPGTEVEVKHYRVVPHYGVASLSLLNRLRKAIYNRVKIRMDHQK